MAATYLLTRDIRPTAVRPCTGLLKLFRHARIAWRHASCRLVTTVIKALKLDIGDAGDAPFALLGVTLSNYLGFRNNAACGRWWEERKLWSPLVFEIRNLSRAATTLISDRNELNPLLMDSLTFCHFLHRELRRVDTREAASPFVGGTVDDVHTVANKTDASLHRMGARLASLKRAKVLEAMGTTASTSDCRRLPPCRPIVSAS